MEAEGVRARGTNFMFHVVLDTNLFILGGNVKSVFVLV